MVKTQYHHKNDLFPFLKQKYVGGAEMTRLHETVPFEHPKHMYKQGKERKDKIIIIITCICIKTWLPTVSCLYDRLND